MFKDLPAFEDPDQKDFELTISKTILTMPEEVQDRFKAIKVLYVSVKDPKPGPSLPSFVSEGPSFDSIIREWSLKLSAETVSLNI